MKNRATFLKRLFCGSLFTLTTSSCASLPYQKSDHFDGKKFFNPGVTVEKGFLSVLKWKWTSSPTKWEDWLNDNATPKVASTVADGEAVVTFINHATYLVQLNGMNVLTDPIFEKRVSPLSWIGPARHRAPGIALNQLPPIHVVFVSHNHYDHMELGTIAYLEQKHHPLFVTPLGNKRLLEKAGAKNVVELDWWESTKLPNGGILHLAQVQHWSSRTMFDRNEALWGGFVMEASGLKIYFGGDSGYGSHYKETHRRYGSMDLSLLPIGAYEPRWFMKEQHIDPTEAVQAHLDLNSRASLGMHFGTFQLTDEGIDQPVFDLAKVLKEKGLEATVFYAPKNGETRVYHK